MQRYSLCGEWIAYLHDSDTVALRNLATQEIQFFVGQAGEQLLDLALSHELLVYANFDGMLYVVDTADKDNASHIRLPSSSIATLVVDRTLVAALLRHTPEESMIFLHDFCSRDTTSFTFLHHATDDIDGLFVLPQALLLSARRGTIDIFGSAWDTPRSVWPKAVASVQVAHRRLSITGELICSSTLKSEQAKLFLSTKRNGNSQHVSTQLGAVQETGRPNIFGIDLELHDTSPSQGRRYLLVFNTTTKELSEIHTMDGSQANNEQSNTLLWRNCAYVSEAPGGTATTRLTRPDRIDHPTVGRVYPRQAFEVKPRHGESSWRMTRDISMNGTFLVHFWPGEGKILVMCFDEAICMARAKSTALWPMPSTTAEEDTAFYQPRIDDAFSDWYPQLWPSQRSLYKCMPFCDLRQLFGTEEKLCMGCQGNSFHDYEANSRVLGYMV